MWAIPTGTSSEKKKKGKESQYMVSHPELGSNPPIGSDRESGCDRVGHILIHICRHLSMIMYLLECVCVEPLHVHLGGE